MVVVVKVVEPVLHWCAYLKTVKCPAAEFEPTGLLVEWEITNVDIAGGFEDCGWLPLNQAWRGKYSVKL